MKNFKTRLQNLAERFSLAVAIMICTSSPLKGRRGKKWKNHVKCHIKSELFYFLTISSPLELITCESTMPVNQKQPPSPITSRCQQLTSPPGSTNIKASFCISWENNQVNTVLASGRHSETCTEENTTQLTCQRKSPP